MGVAPDATRVLHFEDRFRFYREQAVKFSALFLLVEQLLEDAELLPTPSQQYAGAERVFAFLAFILYVSRVSPKHELVICRHRQLWKLAKLRRPPPTTSAELRDGFKAKYRTQILGTITSSSRSSSARTARASTSRPAPTPAARRRPAPSGGSRGGAKAQRIPDHLMQGAPPSVATALAGRCLICGGPHMAAGCAVLNTRSADQKRAVAANLLVVQRIREKRNAWIKQARGRR